MYAFAGQLFTRVLFYCFRSLIIGHFCENNAFFILLSWLPTYFHENFPDAKVSGNKYIVGKKKGKLICKVVLHFKRCKKENASVNREFVLSQ